MLFILVLFQRAPCYLGELPWLLLCNLQTGWELKLPLSPPGRGSANPGWSRQSPLTKTYASICKKLEKEKDKCNTAWMRSKLWSQQRILGFIRTHHPTLCFSNNHPSVKVSTDIYLQHTFTAVNINKLCPHSNTVYLEPLQTFQEKLLQLHLCK